MPGPRHSSLAHPPLGCTPLVQRRQRALAPGGNWLSGGTARNSPKSCAHQLSTGCNSEAAARFSMRRCVPVHNWYLLVYISGIVRVRFAPVCRADVYMWIRQRCRAAGNHTQWDAHKHNSIQRFRSPTQAPAWIHQTPAQSS